MRRVAVMAHYDINGILDSYLKPFVLQLSELCEKVIIVSTSGVMNDWIEEIPNVTIFQKANVGYDFCSYKFGIKQIQNLKFYHQLIVCNDSFYTLNNFSLRQILESSSKKADIIGLTDNFQFSYHLQSYFLIFNQRPLHSTWFTKFWSSVQPLQNKMQIIWRYEIGMSQSALNYGFKLDAVYSSTKQNYRYKLKNRVINRFLGHANPTHMNAIKLAKQVGIAKIDLFRLNISSEPIERFVDISSPMHSVFDAHINRTSLHYASKTNSQIVPSSVFDYISKSKEASRIAVFLHLYHLDLANEIAQQLDKIPENFDLYISICDYNALNNISAYFSGKALNLFITVIENKGRDVLPFFKILENVEYNHYTCILKIHSKKSTYSSEGAVWRQKLFNNLLPSPSKIGRLISKFECDKNLGIVAPFESFLSNPIYWGSNKIRLREIMSKITNTPKEELFFVGGTMFWISPKVLTPILNSLSFDLFEPEAGQQDGTMAHTIERTFCVVANHLGLNCTSMEDLNKHITSEDVLSNRVDVLRSTTDKSGNTVVVNV